MKQILSDTELILQHRPESFMGTDEADWVVERPPMWHYMIVHSTVMQQVIGDIR